MFFQEISYVSLNFMVEVSFKISNGFPSILLLLGCRKNCHSDCLRWWASGRKISNLPGIWMCSILYTKDNVFGWCWAAELMELNPLTYLINSRKSKLKSLCLPLINPWFDRGIRST